MVTNNCWISTIKKSVSRAEFPYLRRGNALGRPAMCPRVLLPVCGPAVSATHGSANRMSIRSSRSRSLIARAWAYRLKGRLTLMTPPPTCATGWRLGASRSTTPKPSWYWILKKRPRCYTRRLPTTCAGSSDPDQMGTVVAVQKAVWQEERSGMAEYLSQTIREDPEILAVYAAYADGQIVSSAWLAFQPPSPFAGLWGGSTLPAYRKQGFYTALVAVRVQEALRARRALPHDRCQPDEPAYCAALWLPVHHDCLRL